LSYNGKSGSGYGNQQRRGWRGSGKKKKQELPPGFSQRDMRLAKAAFQGRSAISQGTDLAKSAPLAPSLEVWLRSPGNWDIPNVDLKLSTNAEDRQRQNAEIAQVVASKKKLEIEVRSPGNKKAVRKFKVLSREEAEKQKREQLEKEAKELEKHPEKALEPKDVSTDDYGRPLKPQMPTAGEIRELAVELYKKNQSLDPLTKETAPEPEMRELREGGYLLQAQRELMQTVNNPSVYEYIENLRSDLEEHGYTIVSL